MSGKKKGAKTEQEEIRLNKYIAKCGVASRRKADKLIEECAVKVNGEVVTEMGAKIKPSDSVSVNGKPVTTFEKPTYVLLNKPKDCITTVSDQSDRKTVMDVVKSRERIFPVGRLDRNTAGVLLLTNDGELTHKLAHPSGQIEKIYKAGLDKKLTKNDAKRIAEGVELDDGKTAPCEVIINPQDATEVFITLTEGRNREVKRIFGALGYEVKKLDRKFFAGLSAQGLKRGEYRRLTDKEIAYLRKIAGLKRR